MDIFHSFVKSWPVSWLLGERRPRSNTLDTLPSTSSRESKLEAGIHASKVTEDSKASQTTDDNWVPLYERQLSRSLPNLFRTTSIQDKSWKLTRQRRKLASYWKRNNNNNNKAPSGDENEGSEVSKMRSSLSVDSLLDDSGNNSDSDVYCSCEDGAGESVEDGHSATCKHAGAAMDRIFVKRTSSIQKKSWRIRQKRKESIHKRRSMDVTSLGQF